MKEKGFKIVFTGLTWVFWERAVFYGKCSIFIKNRKPKLQYLFLTRMDYMNWNNRLTEFSLVAINFTS